jgi:uncharacterized phiE125 gp8 family phage protein
VITPNNNLPVTLDEVKRFCRQEFLIGDTSQDDMITMFINAAIDCFEKISRRTLMKTGFRTYRDCWYQCYELRKSPLDTIDAVKYFDSDAVEQIVDSSEYYIDEDPAYSLIVFDVDYSFPALRANRPNQITIDFTAGYAADESEVPSDIKTALLQHICFMSENRGDCACGDMSAIPSSAKQTYLKYKIEEI